jgi:integrase
VSVVKKNGSYTAFLKPFPGEKRIGLKLDTTSKSEAQQIEAMILRACRTDNYDILDNASREACVRMFRNQGWQFPSTVEFEESTPKKGMTLWGALSLFLNYPEVRQSTNLERIEQAIVHVVSYFGKEFPIKDIWIPEIKGYQLERQRQGAAASTINKEKATLSRLFEVLIESRYLDVNPARMVKPLSEKNAKRHVYLSNADFRKILAVIPAWYAPIVQVAYYSGMRRGEILGLTWKRVNLKTRMIYLGPDEVKERNWKRVPIHQELVSILEGLRSQQVISLDKLFFHNGSAIQHRDQLRWAWDRKVCKLGFESKPNFHDLRHTWKTNARRSGMDPEIRESILGHALRGKSISEGYGVISDEELVNAIDGMSFDHGQTKIWVTEKEKPAGATAGKSKVQLLCNQKNLLTGTESISL